MVDRLKPSIVVIIIVISGIVFGVGSSYIFSRGSVLSAIPPSVLFLIQILALLIIPFLGIFLLIISKENTWKIFRTGINLGIKIGIISLIIFFYFFVLELVAVILSLTLGGGAVAGLAVEGLSKSLNLFFLTISGGGIIIGGLFVGGEGVVALNALKYVSSLMHIDATEVLQKADWRTSFVSSAALVLFFIGLSELSLLDHLFTVLISNQTFGKHTVWIVLSFLSEIVSVMIFGLLITIAFLYNNKNIYKFWQKLILIVGGVVIFSAILLRLAIFVSKIKKINFGNFVIPLIPGEKILFSVFLLFLLLWTPRALVKLPPKQHKRILNITTWVRVIVIPVIAYVVIGLTSPYLSLSFTRIWTIVVFVIIGIYYLYVGVFWALKNKTKFQTWLKERVDKTSEDAPVEEEGQRKNAGSIVNSWLNRVSETYWWQLIELPQNPSVKMLGLGVGSWLLSKLLDSVFEWVFQSNIIPFFISK